MDPALLEMLSMGAPQEDQDPAVLAAQQAALSKLSGAPAPVSEAPAAPAPAPAPALKPQAPSSQSSDVSALLQQYGDAQELARKNRIASGIGQAVDSGISTATNTKPDSALYKSLQDDASAPVKNLQDKNSYAIAMTKAKKDLEGDDPTTNKSRAMQAFYMSQADKMGLPYNKDQILKSSYNDLGDQINVLLKGSQINQSADYHKALIDSRNRGIDSKASAADSKKEDSNNKVFTEAVEKVEDTKKRGSVANAWNAQRQIANAEKIFQENGIDPTAADLDKLPIQKVRLAISEIAKVASGGVPTESGQRELMPSSARSAMQVELSKLKNEPTGAHLGAFLKEYMPYLKALKDNANQAIGEAIDAHRTAYSDRLSPDQLEKFDKQYSKYLHGGAPSPTAGPRPSAEGPGSTRMKLPDGRVVSIKNERLNDAKSHGAVVVQ